MSLPDLNDGTEHSIEVCSDPLTGALLIMESPCWSAERMILFGPGKRVRYVRVPMRPAIPPFLYHVVLGIHNGLIYYKLDSRIYALPFQRLQTDTKLGYTIG